VFIASNIATRLRRREEELEDAYRRLRMLEGVKSQFMRKTSHELRAPIGALQSLLKAALHQMPGEAPGRDLVTRAVLRTEHTLNLIDDLLRYSRLRTAAADEPKGPVDLAEVVRDAADLFQPRAQEKDLRFDVRPEPAPVLGTREGLADLVNNLVSNAIRYTPAGGTVCVRSAAADGRAELVVSDTGIGIPEAELGHVFEEFFRGEEARRTFAHGTGLGMAIVKRVADMHDGRIAVRSGPGQGTQFTVTFPPLPPAAPTEPMA